MSQLGAVTRWSPADAIVLGELGLVAMTGAVMGRVTRFRRVAGGPQYRLTGVGVWLWALFVAIRTGCYLLAQRWGADLAALSGVVLLSFGVNRLVATLVVRRRLRSGDVCFASEDPDHLQTGLEVGRAAS